MAALLHARGGIATATSTSFSPSSAPSRIVASSRARVPVAATARSRPHASISAVASAAPQPKSSTSRSPLADNARRRSPSSSFSTTETAAVAQAKQSFTTTKGPFAGVTNGDQFAAVLKAGELSFLFLLLLFFSNEGGRRRTKEKRKSASKKENERRHREAAKLTFASCHPPPPSSSPLPAPEKSGAAAGKIPPQLVDGFLDFYGNYRAAVVNSGVQGADEAEVARVMTAIADRVLDQFVHPYEFPSAHERILSPYDYYAFGQSYVRNLVDFDRSALGHLDRFREVERQLAAGDNVVLLANHQTEADPAVWALLLEGAGLARLASDVAYVAGDRVVTDPLCKPFSMGRNLFCVHSKKHLDDDPALKEEKQRTNRRTLGALSKALGMGGQLLWIAPSGGRDRPDAATGEWAPAAFDPAAVELMRQLCAKAAPRGHLWPLAMDSGNMMPPPPATEKAIGERRLTNFVGVGISLGEELDLEALVEGIDEKDREARAGAVAAAAFSAVCEQYDALKKAIRGGGATADGAYSQPWKN